MAKKSFIFTKEMAEKLKASRRKANLKQREVADLLGLKSKYGRSFIARLENELIRNPSLRTVLDYLRICGASWVEFLKKWMNPEYC
ncbi:MAG: helix-turn-helix transcriptional regulator [candidate division WOR-3 bacterium]